jgi:general secretion pathway protein A
MNAQPLNGNHSPFITPFTPPEAEADPFTDLVTAGAAAALPQTIPLPPQSFLEFYGLRENPFADCVHPAYFYRTDAHAEAFRSMMLAVEFRSSLGMVTGPSGMGKTLVSQLLLQHLQPQENPTILVLVTPGLSKTGLLREILSELSIPLPVGVNRLQDLLKLLSNHIIDLHTQGRRLVMLIDESHLLEGDCLHVIRTISNIEIPEQKLVTCLLFGEERLARRLEHPSYESLRNRIYLRSTLHSMTFEDAAQYVKYRLMVAGRLTDLFTEGALAALHRHSGGICRSSNKLCMLSMIEGAARRRAQIDETIVDASAARM